MKPVGMLVLILCGLSVTADGQTLAEAARVEALRRAAIDRPAPVRTNTDLVMEPGQQKLKFNPRRPVTVPAQFPRSVAQMFVRPAPNRVRAVNALPTSAQLFAQPLTLYRTVNVPRGLRRLTMYRPMNLQAFKQFSMYRPVNRRIIPHQLVIVPRRW
jgi:hypothetical protein